MTNIDISSKPAKFDKCDLKCAYNFTYSNSNSTAKNNGMSISLTYDHSSVPPVIYDSQKYTVAKINLYSPSLHLFNGERVKAEFVIEHVPMAGGDTLYVCCPIVQSNNMSVASGLLTQIIQNVSSNAPSNGNSTNLNLSGFTLQDIVPFKPYYNYKGTTSGLSGDYIVFDSLEAISLDESTLKTLSNIITPFAIDMVGGSLLYNPNGPNSSLTNQGIYISCQPTGSSEEQVDVVQAKNVTVNDMSSMMNNQVIFIIIQIIVGGLIFIAVYYGINYAYNYFTGVNAKVTATPVIGTK
jgi:carbonic anhydrase